MESVLGYLCRQGIFVADNPTSLSLLDRLRSPADEAAWQRFHDLYGPLIQQWLLRRGIAVHEADDLQQEVMQFALTHLATFEHNGHTGALRCWLRRVVANRLKEFWRRQNRGGLAVGGSEYASMAQQLEDPDSRLSHLWDIEYQQAVCQRLLDLVQSDFQPRTMDAFRKVVIEGRRAQDVADELQMSATAVRIAQSRVLRRMRELSDGMLD